MATAMWKSVGEGASAGVSHKSGSGGEDEGVEDTAAAVTWVTLATLATLVAGLAMT
jgi:hypothetical protein